MAINYLVGDATDPGGGGTRMIAHICNNWGGWGRGFVLALSARWPAPEIQYRAWCRKGMDSSGRPFALGQVHFLLADRARKIVVANMIAQDRRVDYDALQKCLGQVREQMELMIRNHHQLSLHLPRIGTGLGHGTWAEVEPILQREVGHLDVFVYDLPPKAD